MRKINIIFALALALFLPFSSFAQPTTPSAGLTPDSAFYFLDRLGENFREFFTFNSVAKAKLQIEFADERVAEIQMLVGKAGDSTSAIDKAKTLLVANVAHAAEIVSAEKAAGKDVTALAKDLDDQFDASEKLLVQTFLEARAKLLAERKQVKETALAEAKKAGDTALVSTLNQELESIQKQADELLVEKNDIKLALHEEKKKIEQEMKQEDQDTDEIDQNNDEELEQEQEDAELDEPVEPDEPQEPDEPKESKNKNDVESNQRDESGREDGSATDTSTNP